MTAQTESKTKEKTPESRSAHTPKCSCRAVVTRRGLLSQEYEDSSVVLHCACCKAAPALYEALEALLTEYDRWSMRLLPAMNAGMAPKVEQARAALALVKGGE